jgi:MoaA/NifB/PqqE/SkfB family radical SAM enzyme
MKCPYCIHGKLQRDGKDFAAEPFKPSKQWAEALNKIRPQIIDFTGGEPFLQPDFAGLINMLEEDIKVAFTSNASMDFSEFVQRVNPMRIVNITLSFHPTSHVSFDMFVGKIMLLKQRGFPVGVNYVAAPEQMYLIPAYQSRFNLLGLRFHVDPFMQGDFEDKYEFSKQELEFLAPYVQQDRPLSYMKKEEAVVCSAGVSHLSIHPNGDAWRCLNDRFNHKEEKRMGNIFDADFKLLTESGICYEQYRCCGCDRDKVETTTSKVAI